MAPPVDLNYWAILVSAVASFILGALWYSPVMFVKPWRKMMGLTQQHMEEAKKKGMKKVMAKLYIGNFIATLIMVYVLSHFVDYAQAKTITDGLQLGLWVWLGFIATLLFGSILWEGKPFKLFLINAGYRLVELLIVASILSAWA